MQSLTSDLRMSGIGFIDFIFQLTPEHSFNISDYSCALVGDILLQGYLYITENNFAFYSNVFGYVTKVNQILLKIIKLKCMALAVFVFPASNSRLLRCPNYKGTDCQNHSECGWHLHESGKACLRLPPLP